MKKLWYAVIVVAVIYLGWEFFRPRAGVMQSQTGTASIIDAIDGSLSGTPQSQSAEETVPAAVTYSSVGFLPANITIKKGTAVMWTNITNGGMWVSINPITGYDGTDRKAHCAEGAPSSFDQCGASVAGSQWSFTFNKAGTWKYRNEASPVFHGVVTVTE